MCLLGYFPSGFKAICGLIANSRSIIGVFNRYIHLVMVLIQSEYTRE